MNETLETFLYNSGLTAQGGWDSLDTYQQQCVLKLVELTVHDCVDKIETYRIPVGNSRSGELACEWTYTALKEIRDDICEHFGTKHA